MRGALAVDGIVNVIKPPGMSSHQVVNVMRRLINMRKIGHTGTLDPGASGVLTLCLGKGTRVVSYLLEKDKRYIAELTLGLATQSQDASGETLAIKTDFSVSPTAFAETLSSFRGRQQQLPPMTSAIRVDGQRLYKAARAGLDIDRPLREIQIYDLHINKVLPEGEENLHFGSRVLLDIRCSKGTYIRTLCHDIGQALGVGAHMSFLSRLQNGPFSLEDSHTLEELQDKIATADWSFVLPIEAALPNWPKVIVSPLAEQRIKHGNAVPTEDLLSIPRPLVPGDEVLVMGLEGELLALASIEQQQQMVCQPFRVLKG